MAERNLIGLQVREVEIPETPLLEPAETTNTGIQGKFERGVPFQATLLKSESQLREKHGGPRVGETGFLSIREIFRNANPYTLNIYASRVLASDAVAASSAAIAVGEFTLISIFGGTVPIDVFVTITAGTNVGVKIVLEDLAVPTITETYDDLATAEDIVNQINYGIGGPGQSVLARVETTSDVLPPNVAQIAFSLDADGQYRYTDTTLAQVVPTVKAGQKGLGDPGIWANDYKIRFAQDTSVPNERILEVYKTISGEEILQETLAGLTDADWVEKVNDKAIGSKFVYVSVTGNIPAPQDPDVYLDMSGGTEGAAITSPDFIGTAGNGKGWYAFATTPVSLLTAVDIYSPFSETESIDVAQAGDLFAEQVKKRAMCLINVPEDFTLLQIEFTGSTVSGFTFKDLQRPRSFLALYKGFTGIDGELGSTVRIPAVGPVIGAAYVRHMFEESGLPSIAPGGFDAGLRGVREMDVESYTEDDLEYLTHVLGVNAVMLMPAVGHIPRTSRLISTLNKNYDIHKRRVINFLGDTFQTNLGFLEQAPNTPETRRDLIQTLDFFMQPLFNKGMFATDGGYESAVRFKSDQDNNSETDVLNRKLNCLVAVRIVNIVETAFINIANVERRVTIEEL